MAAAHSPDSKKCTATTKAFENKDFLLSHPARNIRILCELEATAAKLQEEGVDATILFFGSARALSKSDLDTQRSNIAAQLEKQPDTESLQMRLQQLQRLEWMCGMYETVAELAERLTLWSQQGDAALSLQHSIIGVTREHPSQSDMRTEAQTHATTKKQRLYVCTGGGPGLMAAANEGAGRVAGARSIGMGISLPHERGLNSFTSDDLAFEFHYFFTRKFWMAYHCEALVAVPGGFGTLDELFEVLTLRQTGKMQRDLPVVLLGTHYWTTIVNWQAMVDMGTILAEDLASLYFTDSAQDACSYIVSKLTAQL